MVGPQGHSEVSALVAKKGLKAKTWFVPMRSNQPGVECHVEGLVSMQSSNFVRLFHKLMEREHRRTNSMGVKN